MALPSDLIDLLVEFDASHVEYLLVGGQAVALHGAPRFTKDADLWLRDSAENVARAVEALGRFGAPPNVLSALREAKGLDVVWMGTPPHRIDLMLAVPDGDFSRAWADHVKMNVEHAIVRVVSKAELIRLKRSCGRKQDLLDAEKLEGG
ncbi:MAG: hypothetical protein AAGN82_17920 [Myxococcota bacterium]